MKYAFIAKHSQGHSVAELCRALGVSRSGFYEWSGREPSKRKQEDKWLLSRICRIHHQSRQAYGARKTWEAMRQEGIICCKHRVARLRKEAEIEARRKRRFRVKVEHHKTLPAAPNRLERDFKQAHPNRAWVGDVTFIRTRAGWLYLAMLLDLYSRKVVGWSMSARNDEALALNALDMAIMHRQPVSGLIHHTDQGGLYKTRAYRERMNAVGMLPSMSGKGNAYDNAVAESFFSNLKNELIHHCDFKTREEARAAIFSYIELFYNRQRIHQTLGYMSPQQFEERMAVA